MAKKRRKPSSKSGGSTLFGIMVGLILGLAAAVAVALFVTQVPMPFVDKASREPAKTLLPDVRNAPDPNLALSGRGSSKDELDSVPPPTQGSAPPEPDSIRSGDTLGDLISSLSSDDRKKADSPTQDVIVPGVTDSAKQSDARQTTSTQTRYYLQAGAFRSASDAESVKARILLLGLPAQVHQAQIDGGTINRVRVGPFTGIDEMNQARSTLGSEKIESTVVRP